MRGIFGLLTSRLRSPLLVIPATLALGLSAAAADDETHWSLRPPARPEVPADASGWSRNAVDRFILDKLTRAGLKPSPEADRRTLIRRVSIDLTGLPPTPAEVDAFLADPNPDAYEKLVDRLLASPRYGERWARHWLDVAHYADSHGQDQDRPRPNAWPYRDYVIRSLNEDKPYGRFVREQIAGDVLFPDDPRALEATGFLAAGTFDESSLVDIREDSADRLVGQYLDRDDIVTSTFSTFVATTVGCARCHDHKFDPITQTDYYGLQAVFAGIDKAERAYDPDPAVARRRADLTAELARVRALSLDDPSLASAEHEAEVAAFEAARKESESRWTTPLPVSWASKDGAILKALLDRSILSIGPRPPRDTYTVRLAAESGTISGLRLEMLPDDTTPKKGPGRQDNGNLHLSEIRAFVEPPGKPENAVPLKLVGAWADFDQDGWGIARAIDGNAATAWGIFPEVEKPHVAVFAFEKPGTPEPGSTLRIELDQVHGDGHLIGRLRLSITSAVPLGEAMKPLPEKLTKATGPALAKFLWERRIESELIALPPPARVYCGTNRFEAKGSFRPAASPRPVFVLKRGEASKPDKPAVPGAVAAIRGPAFTLADANNEGQRRTALANWLADPANPLTWRVIVNRVWHYHFGRGLVETPNDFGLMGGEPSHPELLDWLAVDFRDGGGSLKRLHRLLVTSAAYRQQAKFDATAAAEDGDNRLLWRMNRGKLDAETLRDAVLQANGRLDLTMYGSPVMHFLMSPGLHVTPNADYDRFDLDSSEARRRSIYRYVFRTRPDPMFEALDCPDASQSAPVRATSLGAPQALVLWNNKFLLRNAELLAQAIEHETSAPSRQVAETSRRVLLRSPTPDEAAAWAAYAGKHGLANFCRVILNSSEFLFID